MGKQAFQKSFLNLSKCILRKLALKIFDFFRRNVQSASFLNLYFEKL